MKLDQLIVTTLVAERLGVTPGRVRAMIRAGRLSATKLGRDYFVDLKHLEKVKDRKPGRPRKVTKTSFPGTALLKC
jgi:excisionase family DNA binding protein